MKGRFIFIPFLLLALILCIGAARPPDSDRHSITNIPIESVEEYWPCCEQLDEKQRTEARQPDDFLREQVMPVDPATFKLWKEEARSRLGAPQGTILQPMDESQLFPSAPGVSRKFEGIDQTQAFFSRPPDTNIAVSESHILEAVNSAYRLSTKENTNVLIRPLRDLHNGTSIFLFDPRVHYDRFSKRFIAVVAEASSPYINVAVSKSGAPADLDQSWCNYRIKVNTPRGTLPDFPIVGMNEKWLAITTNQFGSNFSRFVKTLIKIVDLSKLGNNASQCPKAKVYSATDSNAFVFPAQHHSQGGSNHPLYMISSDFTLSSNRYSLYTVSGSARPSVSKKIITGSEPYGFPPDALQKGGTPLETMGPTINDAEFRNGSLYFTHTTICNTGSLPNETCIRVAKLDVSGNAPVFDFQSTVGGGQNNYFWFPALGVNLQGDTALLFQESGKTRRLGLAHTSKSAAAGKFSSYKIVKKGECPREFIDSNDRNRTGDYTGVHIDPSDDKGVWYAAEYAKKLGGTCGWGTFIVNVKNP